jgi:hypothetical protein
MTTFRCELFLLLLISTGAAPSAAVHNSWTYADFSQSPYHSVEAVLFSRDGSARLAINCSHAGAPTLSLQYRPDPTVGIGMAPVVLDWTPSRAESLNSKLTWEPDQRGAFARDGIDDRYASDVAKTIEGSPGTLHIIAANRDGRPVETIYDSTINREVIGRVLSQCPWNPHRAKGERGLM